MPYTREVWHVADEDDDLQFISAEYGIKDWEAVFNAPENDPLRKLKHQFHVVLDEQNGNVLGQICHDSENLRTFVDRNSGGGFVQQQDAWTSRKRNCNLQQPLFAIWQIAGKDIAVVSQMKGRKEIKRFPDGLCLLRDCLSHLTGAALALAND